MSKDNIPYTTVDFNDDGSVKIEGHGYVGGACVQSVKEVEASMTERSTVIEKKPSFFQKAVSAAKARVGL